MGFETNWNNRILVVDDQEEIHDDLEDMLTFNSMKAEENSKAQTDALVDLFLDEPEKSYLPDFEILHAMSGEQACEIVKASKESNRPIAVGFIDVRMPPGIDGIEAIHQIRQMDKNIELVIMTAYTDRPLPEIIQDMELLHKLLYIRKPFVQEEIQQLALSLVEKWNIDVEKREAEQGLIKNKQQLIISHKRLETLLDSTGDAIGMFDVDGHLMFANQWYEELFELTESELKQMAPNDHQARVKARFQEPISPEAKINVPFGNAGMVEDIMEVSESKPRLFRRLTAPVHDDKGNIASNIIIYRDRSKEIEFDRIKFEVSRLRNELGKTYSFSGIIAKSPKMQEVFTLIQRAAESNITVLIQGENGTGKELVAKSTHFNSDRKAGPFVVVNCAAIPDTLIESELFGHERGAFTGATTQKIGQFEQANGGTIFLDEIGDMPLNLQVKLLRVLQERELQRVGGTKTIPLDIRIIAATNQDLPAAVEAGDFRVDLFYRLAAYPIEIPPLRDRREDIPLLARHFLKKYTENSNKSISEISPGALQLLIWHDFPGNVRELENIIERAVLLETTDSLQASNLSSSVLPISTSQAVSPHLPSTPILPLVEVEKQALAHALETTDNNVNKAAQALGINRGTLYRKLKAYQLLASE